jgi:regulator of sigma D
MRKTFVVLAILINSFLVFYKTNACADSGESWWERPKYLFVPEMLSDKTYTAYFDSWPFYSSSESENFSPMPAAMVLEWQQRFPKVNPKDISSVLFNLNDQIIEKLKNKQNPIPGNSFFEAILNAGDTYIDYLGLVKDDNDSFNKTNNEWETPELDLNKVSVVLAAAKNNVSQLKNDPFLLQKYMYMIVKLNHYSKQFSEVVSAFDNLADPVYKSLSYYRGMSYKAGALRMLGDTVQAKVLFARIFDQCEPLRITAYRNFKYIQCDINKCLNTVSLSSEKSAIWMLQYVYNDQRDYLALEELYKNDPTSGRLEVVLLKELNIIHEEYLTLLTNPYNVDSANVVLNGNIEDCGNGMVKTEVGSDKGWFAKMWDAIVNFFKNLFGSSKAKEKSTKDQKIENVTLKLPFFIEDESIGEYIGLLEKINSEGKVKNIELFKTALAYIYLINGKFEKAQPLFDELVKSNNKEFKNLNEYLSIWTEMANSTQITASFEDHFTSYHKTNDKSKDLYQTSRLIDLQAELVRRYLIEAQYNKALLVNQAGEGSDMLNAFFTCDMLDNLETYIKEKPKTKLEEYFKPPSIDKVKALKTSRYIQMGKFEEALAISPKFIFEIYDKKKQANVTLATLKDLVTWEKTADAESFAKIANVIGNSDLWSYNACMWHYYCIYHPNYSPYWASQITVKYPFNVSGLAEAYLNRAYLEAKRNNSVGLAQSFYLKAIEKSSDKEFQAKMYFQAQEVKIKSMYEFDDKGDYYALLKEKYSDTQFYKQAYNSCAYLRLGKVVGYEY